jgi:hypothetical protein
VISRATPQFCDLFRVLPPDVRAAARKAYEKFSENPVHPSLRLERLRSDRRAGEEWVWLWIGDHKKFDRRFPA